MGRHSCCYKQKLRKGLWSPEEDEKLLRHITKYGHGCWSSVPKQAGLQRCGKSCRLRWINYLRPDLKRGTFSEDEENLIVELHKVLGNRWSQIAAQLPGRTDNEIKNLWNSCLKKKLRQRGIDPVTHKPLSEVENGEANVTTTTNSIEMVSGISNELNLLQVDNSNSNSNSKSGATVLERRPSLVSPRGGYPPEVEGNSGSKMAKSNNNINNGNRVTPTSNKDFFLDRFVNSHNESSTTTSSHPSDFMGYFPLQQLNYASSSNRTSVNPNSTLWFTQPGSKTYDMNSEFSSINNTISAVLPPMNSLKSSLTAFHSQSPSMSSSFDINGCRYWEVGASSNSSSSSGSNSSAELHNNNNAFENSLFSWGLADCSTSDKDSQIHLMETVQEDIKWPEILRNPFLMASATFQNQTPQPLYNEIKSETQFDSRNISAMWPHHNQQQQEPLQTSDICTAAFGHI